MNSYLIWVILKFPNPQKAATYSSMPQPAVTNSTWLQPSATKLEYVAVFFCEFRNLRMTMYPLYVHF